MKMDGPPEYMDLKREHDRMEAVRQEIRESARGYQRDYRLCISGFRPEMKPVIQTPPCFRCGGNAVPGGVHCCEGKDRDGDLTKEIVILCAQCIDDLSDLCFRRDGDGRTPAIRLACRHCRCVCEFVRTELLST